MSEQLDALGTLIIQAVTEAEGGHVSIEEIAAKAGCKRRAVLNRLQDKAFRDLFLEAYRNNLAAEVPAVVHSFLAQAKQGSFQHGKLLLEVAGFYTQKQVIDGNLKVAAEDSPFKTEEERAAFAAATLAKFVKKESESSDGD